MISWVTLYNDAYEPLARTLERGLAQFSNYPLKLHYATQKGFRNVCLEKFQAILEAPTSHVVYLDADTVPARNVDEFAELAPLTGDFPVPVMHPNKHCVFDTLLKLTSCARVRLPYGQSNALLVGPKGKAWIEANLEEMRKLSALDERYDDEQVLGAFLARDGAMEIASYSFPHPANYANWSIGNHDNMHNSHVGALVTWHGFHGGKDVTKAQAMLEDMSAKPLEFTTGHALRSHKPFIMRFA